MTAVRLSIGLVPPTALMHTPAVAHGHVPSRGLIFDLFFVLFSDFSKSLLYGWLHGWLASRRKGYSQPLSN